MILKDLIDLPSIEGTFYFIVCLFFLLSENGQNGTNVELEAVLLSVGGAVAFICLITILICLRNWRRNKVGVKVTFISVKCTH